jgi:hypothetical protein
MSWLEDKDYLIRPEPYSSPLRGLSGQLIGHRDCLGNISSLTGTGPVGLHGPAIGSGLVYSPCGNIVGRIDAMGTLSPPPTIDLPKPHW